jgi:Fur family ferric uptake transcriptional regulator
VVGAMPCLAPSSTSGYEVDEAEVIFWGYCPSCQSASN